MKYVNMACLFLNILLSYSISYATTPPESYFPKTAKMQPNPVDPALERWFANYAEKANPMDLTPKEFDFYLQKKEHLIKTWLKLRYVNSISESTDERTSALNDALAEINQIKDNKMTSFSKKAILAIPYLLEEILYIKNLNEDIRIWIEQILRDHGQNTCPGKQLLLKDIGKDRKENISLLESQELLERIAKFKSSAFKKQALENLLEIIPSQHHQNLRNDLSNLAKDYSDILEDNHWIVDDEENFEEDDDSESEPYLSFQRAQKALSKNRCNTARSFLLKGFQKDSDKTAFDPAMTTALKVEGCYRRKGTAARLRFWYGIQKQLGKSYDFPGEELAMRKRGLIYWGKDDFEEARKIFSSLLERARKENNKQIEGETVYTFARIEENNGNLTEAIKYYEYYFQNFKDEEKIDNSLMSLILLNTMIKSPHNAIQYVEKLVKRHTIKDIDESSTAALAFGLFWGGRIYYSLGKEQKAKEMWRRVASEFYSTFYGAIGHFMLEKTEGRPLQLQPTLSAPFNIKNFYTGFDHNEKKSIHRILALLELGMREEASCEISELAYKDNENDKILTISMLLYAASDWLEAIKKYGNLPRSFRHGLPVGMEKLLFPKAYSEEVTKYAAKLNLDSDFIFAIIRQESVFNPKARSPVGARGLMQLMPRTAQMEARRLRIGYVNRQERREIIGRTQGYKNLYDASTNLLLGIHHVHTLLNRYKNPIFVLTAYNASPSATEKWKKKMNTFDVLSFIERIPYEETRTYVKLVLRNYFYYRRWYNNPSMKLPHLEMLIPKIEEKDKYISTIKYDE